MHKTAVKLHFLKKYGYQEKQEIDILVLILDAEHRSRRKRLTNEI